MATPTNPLASPGKPRLGCLGQLGLLVVIGIAVGVVIPALLTPWAFYMGGNFHLLPMWSGWGRLHSTKAGGDFAVLVTFYPHIRKGTGLTHVSGNAVLCTPAGEKLNLNLGGDFQRDLRRDTDGKTASFYMYSYTVSSQFSGDSRPHLELRGHWKNPDLVLDDHGSIARSFEPDGKLYTGHSTSRPYMAEVVPVTLHEGGEREFEAACTAVKKSHTERKLPATEEDAKAGRAIFYIPGGRSVVYDLGRPLPLAARIKHNMDLGTAGKQHITLSRRKPDIILAGTIVEIVQCEIGDTGDILVGFRYAGGDGICMLDELEII
jgi:hypothetical protein